MKRGSSAKNFILALGLSSYPVSLLFTLNYNATSVLTMMLSLLFVYLFSTFIFIIFYILNKILDIRNYHIQTSLATIIFFTYGMIYSYLSDQNTFISAVGRHRYLLPLTILFGFLVFHIINKCKETSATIRFITIFLLVFNLLPFFTLAKNLFFQKKNQFTVVNCLKTHKITSNELPNIYYIILDGYGSDNAMKTLFKYDNNNFTTSLANMGFKVQKNSSSNYNGTIFSLSSILNLNYIQNIIKKNIYQYDVHNLISNNLVAKTLESYGYNYYIFDSGYGQKKEFNKNEFFIETLKKIRIEGGLFSTSDEDFLNTLTNNSVLRIYQDNFFARISMRNYANKILNVFVNLPKIASNTDKKFVFAHIISPHPPYLFNEQGELTFNYNLNWDINLHIKQLKFINKKVLVAVNEIINYDRRDKIIIIQGDHGSRILTITDVINNDQNWVKEQYSNLNAIYISRNDKIKTRLYNNWNYSSVNTFRLIFNEYFNYELPLLRDEKYHSKPIEPYIFSRLK